MLRLGRPRRAQKFWLIGLACRRRMDHTIDLFRAEKGVLPKIAVAHDRKDQRCI
jgi:hypothetical protein